VGAVGRLASSAAFCAAASARTATRRAVRATCGGVDVVNIVVMFTSGPSRLASPVDKTRIA
jgi:hypothetical protein